MSSLEQLARNVVVSWAHAKKVMTTPTFLRKHEAAVDELVEFLADDSPYVDPECASCGAAEGVPCEPECEAAP